MRNFLILPYVALTNDFAHLEGMVSKQELRLLNSLKDSDKKRMMERIFEDMDADVDNYLEPNELHTWIHYLGTDKSCQFGIKEENYVILKKNRFE